MTAGLPWSLSPLLPWWAIVLPAVAAALLWLWEMRRSGGAWSARRRAAVGVLRASALLGLVVALLQPGRVDSGAAAGAVPPVLIVLDDSESMGTADVVVEGQSVRRFDAAATFLQQWLSWNDSNLTFRIAAVSESAQPVEAGEVSAMVPDGRRSRLLDAIEAMAAERPLAIVVLSDGHDTRRSDFAETGQAVGGRGVPVYSVPFGGDAGSRNVALRAWADRSEVFAGQGTTLRIEARQRGFDAAACAVEIVQNGEVIASRRLAFEGRPTARLSVPVLPVRGEESAAGSDLCAYEVRLSPLPGESTEADNRRWVFVEITDERLRAVVLENQPYWDTTALIEALRADPQIDLTTVTGLGRIEREVRSGAEEAETPGSVLPLSRESLAGVDVLILGRGTERWLGAAEAGLLSWFVVEHGGGLVLSRGDPLGGEATEALRAEVDRLSPVTWERGGGRETPGQLAVTPQGRAEGVLGLESFGDPEAVLTELPGLIALTKSGAEKSMSTVWLRGGEGEPLGERGVAMAHLSIGRGRTLAVLTEGLWRWSLLPPEQSALRPVHALFWGRAARWMAGGDELLPGRSLGLSLDRVQVSPGEMISMQAAARHFGEPPSLRLVLTEPDGGEREISLLPEASTEDRARFSATVSPQTPGPYALELSVVDGSESVRKRFAVADDSPERADVSARPEALAALSQASGGRVIDRRSPDSLRMALQAGRPETTASPTFEPVIPPTAAALWVAVCVLAEWVLRRRAGGV